TFSRGSLLSIFAFQEGMLGTPVSALKGWPTVTLNFCRAGCVRSAALQVGRPWRLRRVGVLGVRLHVGAQNSVDARLVATLLPEPGQQVGVKPHGDNLLAARQDDLGLFPEVLFCRMRVRIRLDECVNLGVAHPAQLAPVGAALPLSLRALRGVASSIAV